ncbi:MAG: FixH family protein [Hyphomonadaceae bacterium]|nr:FixH family protein [Hyphomonadaceae bacterium]
MQASKGLRGVHVLWMVIAFFAFIIGTDTYFIIRAVNTFPGEQVRNSYVLGLDYNREIEGRNRQAELGWKAEAGVINDGRAALVVRFVDKAQSAVTGLDVRASYFVVGGGREDHVMLLAESAPGEYRVYLEDAHAGRAEFTITAARGDGETVFRASKVAVIP